MSRPSTSCLLHGRKDVDARHIGEYNDAVLRTAVPGHDGARIEKMTDIRVPTLGESVTEATIGKWFKKPGDPVAVDEPLVELETDKVTLEVPAPAAGVLSDIAVKDGATVAVGAVLGPIKEGAGAFPTALPATAPKPAASPTGAPNEKTATTKPIGAGPEQPQPREM